MPNGAVLVCVPARKLLGAGIAGFGVRLKMTSSGGGLGCGRGRAGWEQVFLAGVEGFRGGLKVVPVQSVSEISLVGMRLEGMVGLVCCVYLSLVEHLQSTVVCGPFSQQ
jgi:hypothetical protein